MEFQPGNDPEPAPRPAVGSLVHDGRRQAIGVVMGHVGPNYQLRPPSGGREWDAAPGDLRPLSPAEALAAKVAEANRQSRQPR
ncbi:hypothetical protein [Streptomyces sp. B6B3]|uniref:hypothetical protein n=1 Tax=Streptomyces sp. B6B3 TaxID=3153570 RepID=UPI00325CAE70